MKSIYNVPVIPQNLSNSETIVQIAEALNYLSDVANDIFNRINDRTNTYSSKISSVNERITLVSNKIINLEERGANKATRVFSSSKYPAGDLNKKYITIFQGDDVLPIKHFATKSQTSVSQSDNTDTLQIYHVKKHDKVKTKLVGLGTPPTNIVSINDMLLFNSGINLYDNYVFSDTLKVSSNTKVITKQEESEIGVAPFSLTENNARTKSVRESYSYAPDLGDVPTIDLPLDLPNLPGIADDVRYINDSGPTIAPSFSFGSNSQDDTISDDTKTVDLSDIELPPPPQSEVANIVEEEVIKESVEMQLHTEDVKEIVTPKVEIPVANNNAHANLMEAIRKAGGSKNAKLKSTDAKKSSIPEGGDLMADLHAKLSMRRKGISGEQNAATRNQPLDATSTMNRLSSMIPPPPTVNDVSESNTTDEEWDD